MIKPRIGKNNKLLIIYDQPQSDKWGQVGICNQEGILPLLKGLLGVGISLDDVSMVCLSDSNDGKAAGYKEKEPHIAEFIGSCPPNLLLFASAKAFELCMGSKGASKFYGRVVFCEKYGIKALTIPPYSMIKHNPDIEGTINVCLALAGQELNAPDFAEEDKAEKFYTMVDSIDKFRAFLKFYTENVFRYALDIETSSLQFNKGAILTIQFSHKAHYGYCIPTPDYFGNWTAEEWDEVVSGIKLLIEDDIRMKIGANIYFDLKHLTHKYGIKLVKENVYDVLIASFLCNENRESHSLKFCAATLLDGFGDYEAPLEQYKDEYCKKNKLKKGDFSYDLFPLEILFPYACMDVDASIQLADYFDKELVVEEQTEVFKEVTSYAYALARIEMNGWQIDLEEADNYRQDLEERIEALTTELKELPEIKKAVEALSAIALLKENTKRKTPLVELKKPLEFLVSSTAHKRYLFRDLLKFPQIKKTKKGEYAVDKECFAVWAEEHPEVEAIKCIKAIDGLKKMLSTYVMALLNRSVDGRIHCSFRVTGAATGRISSSQPNLQNVQMHSEEAKRLKKCFVAACGHSLVVADLSNAELRITAALSQDPVMCEGFRNGLDPHSNTAKEVFKLSCPVGEIKGHPDYDKYRQMAKTLGFAALYGASPSKIAKGAGITEIEAQRLLSDYFTRHSGVQKMLNDNVLATAERGYSVAITGRKRRVPYINSTENELVERAKRQANNFIVQSVASDGMLQSLVCMLEEIDRLKLPYKIINVIHDSCEMEVPDPHVPAAHEFIIRHLSRWPKGLSADFVMKADAEVGKTWADLKEPDFDWHHDDNEEEEDDDCEE